MYPSALSKTRLTIIKYHILLDYPYGSILGKNHMHFPILKLSWLQCNSGLKRLMGWAKRGSLCIAQSIILQIRIWNQNWYIVKAIWKSKSLEIKLKMQLSKYTHTSDHEQITMPYYHCVRKCYIKFSINHIYIKKA